MLNFNLQQIKRFLISGGSATSLHFAVMGLLIYMGMDAVLATAIGAASGAALNYILQYYYTFVSDRQHLHSMAAYLAAAMLAWITNLVIFALLHKILVTGVIVAQLIATLIVTFQNYVIYKKLVFFQGAEKTAEKNI